MILTGPIAPDDLVETLRPIKNSFRDSVVHNKTKAKVLFPADFLPSAQVILIIIVASFIACMSVTQDSSF